MLANNRLGISIDLRSGENKTIRIDPRNAQGVAGAFCEPDSGDCFDDERPFRMQGAGNGVEQLLLQVDRAEVEQCVEGAQRRAESTPSLAERQGRKVGLHKTEPFAWWAFGHHLWRGVESNDVEPRFDERWDKPSCSDSELGDRTNTVSLRDEPSCRLGIADVVVPVVVHVGERPSVRGGRKQTGAIVGWGSGGCHCALVYQPRPENAGGG